jgi:hypothetical protein
MDAPDPEPPLTPVPNKRKKRELTGDDRRKIVSRLMFEMQERGFDGKFSRGTMKVVAGEYHMCVCKQLGECGSVPVKTSKIQTLYL